MTISGSSTALHAVLLPVLPGAVNRCVRTLDPSMPFHRKLSYGMRLYWFHDILVVTKYFIPLARMSCGREPGMPNTSIRQSTSERTPNSLWK